MYLSVSTKNTKNLCRQAWVPKFVFVGSKKLSAALWTDEQTDGWINGQMDLPSQRDTKMQLKSPPNA